MVATGKTPRRAALAFVCLIAAFGLRCTTDSPSPAPTPAIRVLQPALGKTYRLSDTVRIVAECDYGQFASGINVDFSADSAKTWEFIQSRPRKEGVAKDTLEWVPSVDHPGMLAAGPGVLVRVYDYDQKFVERSGFFSFSP